MAEALGFASAVHARTICGTSGHAFPGSGDAFVGKDTIADYLESYAEHFHLPVSTGMKVNRLSKRDGKFRSKPICNVSKPTR